MPDAPVGSIYGSFVLVWNCALAFQPDHILITGDLSNRGESASYELLAHIFSSTTVPVSILYGNHDRPCELMDRRCHQHFYLGNWQVICLDSVKLNSIFGEGAILQSELEWLTQVLRVHDRPVIALHHHPVSNFTDELAWLNQIQLTNGQELIGLLLHFPQVRLVICGHIHRVFCHHINHLTFLSAPATCYQVYKREEPES